LPLDVAGTSSTLTKRSAEFTGGRSGNKGCSTTQDNANSADGLLMHRHFQPAATDRNLEWRSDIVVNRNAAFGRRNASPACSARDRCSAPVER
jgi:hypothetical protein